MNSIQVNSSGLGKDFSLSPEHWLSTRHLENLESGVSLLSIVSIEKRGMTKTSENVLVLDTGHAENGALSLNLQGFSGKERTSQKKHVPAGSVIISRLRPYLRQVAYIPTCINSLLKVDAILCSTEFYVLVAKDSSESIAYLVPWLLSTTIQDVFYQATTGGHHPRFDENMLTRLSIPKIVYSQRVEVSKMIELNVENHLRAQVELASIVARNGV